MTIKKGRILECRKLENRKLPARVLTNRVFESKKLLNEELNSKLKISSLKKIIPLTILTALIYLTGCSNNQDPSPQVGVVHDEEGRVERQFYDWDNDNYLNREIFFEYNEDGTHFEHISSKGDRLIDSSILYEPETSNVFRIIDVDVYEKPVPLDSLVNK